jgi:CelD/BcsL family acetyltransferase involved in cellulose biosynthesis
MHIEIVDTLEGFEVLREEWEDLVQSSSCASVFVSWHWQYHWWRNYYRVGDQLRILVVRADSQVVGILPLYITRKKILKFFQYKVLQFIGIGGDTSPDYLDAIVVADKAEQTLKSLVDFIFEKLKDWQLLTLSEILSDSLFLSCLIDTASRQGLATKKAMRANISYIELPDDWEKYLKQLSANRRAQLRRSRKKFYSAGDGKCFTISDEKRLDWAIDKLIELHHKRWQGRAEHYAFSSPNYISFHRSVMHDFIKQNRLRLFCLTLDEKIISMLYCYRWKDTMYYFQGGFDPDYQHLQPGQVIMGHAIESAIQERLKVFDMLKGDYEYKASLAKSCKCTWSFYIFKRNIPIYIYRLNFHWLPVVKIKIKELIEKYLVSKNA